MNAIIQELQQAGISIALGNNETIRCTPKEQLTEELRDKIKANKAQIIQVLQTNQAPVESSEPVKIQLRTIPAYKLHFYKRFNEILKQLDELYPSLSDEQNKALCWVENLLCTCQGDKEGQSRLEQALKRLKERWLLWTIKTDSKGQTYYLADGAQDIPWFDEMGKEQETKQTIQAMR